MAKSLQPTGYFLNIHLFIWPSGIQVLSSLTRDRTCAPCSGSTESQPLDCRPLIHWLFNKIIEVKLVATPLSVGILVLGDEDKDRGSEV